MTNKYVEYSSNNSGGRWWLTDDDWIALEKAGWKVHWACLESEDSKKGTIIDKDGLPRLKQKERKKKDIFLDEDSKDGKPRWMGALARAAYFKANSLQEAVESWERATNKSALDPGCPCCGQPHYFTLYDGDTCVDNGPHTNYSASW